MNANMQAYRISFKHGTETKTCFVNSAFTPSVGPFNVLLQAKRQCGVLIFTKLEKEVSSRQPEIINPNCAKTD